MFKGHIEKGLKDLTVVGNLSADHKTKVNLAIDFLNDNKNKQSVECLTSVYQELNANPVQYALVLKVLGITINSIRDLKK